MGKGNFFDNVFKVIKDAFSTFWSYVEDYWKNFVNNPSGFIENHTFVFLAVVFILILLIVLIINLLRNISDRREAKKKKLESLIAQLKEEDLERMAEASLDEEAKVIEEQEETIKVEEEIVKEDVPVTVEEPIEVEEEVALVEEPKMEETKETVEVIEEPLPTVVNAEEEREIPMEEPTISEEKEVVEEKSEEVIPEYEFVAEVRIINAKEESKEENIPEVRVEVAEPSFYKEEFDLNTEPKKEIEFAFEDEELDLDFDDVELKREPNKEEVPIFDPIPELRALERTDINGLDEILYEEEKEVTPEPIVMEKIEVVKVNPAQKFGLKNMDTNRQGKTFTYDELDKLIKD